MGTIARLRGQLHQRRCGRIDVAGGRGVAEQADQHRHGVQAHGGCHAHAPTTESAAATVPRATSMVWSAIRAAMSTPHTSTELRNSMV